MKYIVKKGKNIAGAAVAAGLMLVGSAAFAADHPTLKNMPVEAEQLPQEHEMIVAYYGRPGVKSLGVLGQYPIGKLKPIIKEKAAAYAKITGKHVLPGFDIIYGLAAASPGPHKDYIIHLGEKKLEPYIKAAENEGFILFVETQLGKNRPQTAIHHIVKYLKHHNVHMAVDPEFEVNGLSVRPGKVIGRVEAAWINQVQAVMDKYMRENGIKEKKILLLHMFRETMVEHKEQLKHYDNIDLIFNLDGHGSPRLKVDIYNAIYTGKYADKVAGGFKLFFKEDHPMMTAKQVMGQESVDGVRIKHPPKYINFE